jgi:hypothetical protein
VTLELFANGSDSSRHSPHNSSSPGYCSSATGRWKLFPIRLVDFDTLRHWECFDADTGKDLAVEVREYFIPDFTRWKDHDTFERAFARFLKDLQATEALPMPALPKVSTLSKAMP